MILLDEWADSSRSDAQNLNALIEHLAKGLGGGDIGLGARTHLIDEPIVLRSGVRLRGEGAMATRLAATPALDGPLILSHRGESLKGRKAWLVTEGVPVRFAIFDLLIDGSDGVASSGFMAGVGAYLYGKGFEICGVQISNMKGPGLVSEGPMRGGAGKLAR